ncbi:hypothetical protein EYC54_11845 [Xanthomonas oryzae]|nr:hypothetical protein EYC54_11845 [Xanthomonas oryzae]
MLIYTFWEYFRQHFARDRGLRIDHLLLSRKLAPGLQDAGVDKWVRALEKASDHAPTWINVRVRAAPGDSVVHAEPVETACKSAAAKKPMRKSAAKKIPAAAAKEASKKIVTKPAATASAQPRRPAKKTS